ncbi:hypothetical protein IEQ34_012141 [Dendrobium chrysotoxum]|uniref:Uncharacterized protein n=1 Tax=Dendrobium chrysotoxum TaxID=161865 RepID=A0AAV7GSF3_DENCH|nr:hypothetical protein IEQ34_012141 [Dendrobium chrysotoxum]
MELNSAVQVHLVKHKSHRTALFPALWRSCFVVRLQEHRQNIPELFLFNKSFPSRDSFYRKERTNNIP